MDDNEYTNKEGLVPFASKALSRSSAMLRRGLQALACQENRVDVRKDLARTLLHQLITLATEAIYSERFEEFDATVAWLSNNKPGIALLRAYVAIQTASQLTEPLNDADLDRALDVLRSSEQRDDSPEFQAILDVHKELAELHWLRKFEAILKRKLANKNDEYSYEGTLYSLEREKKGPTTEEERTRYEPICKQMADLNRQIEEKELSLLKDQDEQEYRRYKEELEAWALREEIDRLEGQAVELGLAESISMLETELDALLNNAE
jgi:hypothetical protein